jgi:succinate dehydrogenase/fumarate reductase flavoprotein subunit
MMSELKDVMWCKVGAFRNADDLAYALDRIRAMRRRELDELSVSAETIHNASLVEWFELRNGLQATEATVLAALHRRESRGAHQRDDFPHVSDEYQRNQRVWLSNGELVSSFAESSA